MRSTLTVYPNATSRDIITKKPTTAAQLASLPFPLQSETKDKHFHSTRRAHIERQYRACSPSRHCEDLRGKGAGFKLGDHSRAAMVIRNGSTLALAKSSDVSSIVPSDTLNLRTDEHCSLCQPSTVYNDVQRKWTISRRRILSRVALERVSRKRTLPRKRRVRLCSRTATFDAVAACERSLRDRLAVAPFPNGHLASD